jgi:hypothetical protein
VLVGLVMSCQNADISSDIANFNQFPHSDSSIHITRRIFTPFAHDYLPFIPAKSGTHRNFATFLPRATVLLMATLEK